MGKLLAYHLPGAWGLVSVSLFCLKLDDSTLIILYFKQRFGVDPNQSLSDEQQGVALAIQRMVEENLYWAMVNDRWNTPENWPLLKSTVLGGIPALPREIMAPFARCGVLRPARQPGRFS